MYLLLSFVKGLVILKLFILLRICTKIWWLIRIISLIVNNLSLLYLRYITIKTYIYVTILLIDSRNIINSTNLLYLVNQIFNTCTLSYYIFDQSNKSLTKLTTSKNFMKLYWLACDTFICTVILVSIKLSIVWII